MKKCDEIDACRFFNAAMREMPTVAEMMKQRYCYGDYDRCARKVVFRALGEGHVPVNLAPNDDQRAREIIGENR